MNACPTLYKHLNTQQHTPMYNTTKYMCLLEWATEISDRVANTHRTIPFGSAKLAVTAVLTDVAESE